MRRLEPCLPDATVRVETRPGEEAQVDFGYAGKMIDPETGELRKTWAFVMTLSWSRHQYAEFVFNQKVETWLRLHRNAFAFFAGVPQVVLHDNLKTAVLEREADGTIHWNPRYLDFAHYYGFRAKACRPYRAQTKGKVESGIRYVRANFWPGLRFFDLADLNEQALGWLDMTANVRLHGTTGEVPLERLALEPLQSLAGKPDYDTSLIGFRRVTKDCFISYDGNYYSVPSKYARTTVEVKETEDHQLIILNAEDEEIARHRVVTGHKQRIAVAAHYESIHSGSRTPSRPTAIQVLPPEDWGDLPLAPEVEARPLSWYDQVLEVVR